MADYTIQMSVAGTQEAGARPFAFEYSQSLAAAGDTKYILIPDDIQNISITAQAAGAGTTATVYSSTDLISILKSGSGITWIPWAAGAVTTATASVFAPVTAIKMTQVGTGTSSVSMRCQ
jgi:hypothetical protein